MPRCGCSDSCSCLLIAGEGVTVDGIGSIERPYEINVVATELLTRLEFTDSSTVDFTTSGVGSEVDPYEVTAKATVKMSQLSDVGAGEIASDGDSPVWHTDHWTFDPAGMNQATADARYVNLTGDTMTGPLDVPEVGNSIPGQDLKLSSSVNANGKTIWGIADPQNVDWVATKGYVDAHAGGSGGIPPSGTWGTAPLNLYGADSLVGRETYTDSAGKLRTKPDQITGVTPTSLAAAYPTGTSIFYIPNADTALWPVNSNGTVVTSKTANNVLAQTCTPFTAVSTKMFVRNGTSTGWSPWVLVADSTAAPVSTAVSSQRQCSIAQSITSGTSTPVIYDVQVQNDIPWATDHFTVATAGLYAITAGHHFAPNVTGYRTVRIMVNGASVAVSQGAAAPAGGAGPAIATIRKLQPGDQVQIQVTQGSGVALALSGGTTYNWVDITRVDGMVSAGAAVADTGWKDCTGILTGWTVPGGYVGPQARQIGNVVRLRGSLANAAFSGTFTTVATLPAGIGLPLYSLFPALGGSNLRYGAVAIRNDGQVQFACNAASGSYFGLDSITYTTD
jgi:hypothetical protein